MLEAVVASTKFSAAIPAPPSVDWRNKTGNWVTGIRYQAQCGSCVAHATCAAMESRTLIASNRPNTDFNLSESHLFACGGGNCANVTVDLLGTSSVHVDRGGSIDVEVPAKGATGHVWTVKADPSEVKIIGHRQMPSTTSFGGGGTEVFTVQALKEGNSKIVFQLGAPWKQSPAEEHELVVECKIIK